MSVMRFMVIALLSILLGGCFQAPTALGITAAFNIMTSSLPYESARIARKGQPTFVCAYTDLCYY